LPVIVDNIFPRNISGPETMCYMHVSMMQGTCLKIYLLMGKHSNEAVEKYFQDDPDLLFYLHKNYVRQKLQDYTCAIDPGKLTS
jgi:hypothetical protein